MLSKEELEEMMNEPRRPEFTEREEAFRRGFTHGVIAAIEGGITIKEAYEWRNGWDETCPPGTIMAGTKLHGLTEDEPHRFFMDRLKPME